MPRVLLTFALLSLVVIGVSRVASAQSQACATDGSSASVNASSATLHGRSMWHVQSSGCYPWNPPKQQSTPNTPSISHHDVYFPKNPVISSTPYMVGRTALDVMGMIGITLSGVAVFGDGDAQGRPVYQFEAKSLDSCNGHADMSGTYHVHTMTGGCCSYPAQNGTAHSPFWAVMADGIPVAGPLGDNGQVPTDLDECRGHTDETYSFYHYHVTSTISQDPYIVGCLKGCVFHNFGNRQLNQLVNANCTPASTQYNYSSLKMTWSAAQVSASTIEACPYTYSPKDNSTSPPIASAPSPNGTIPSVPLPGAHGHHRHHHGNRTHSHHPAHHGNRTHSHHPAHHGNMTHSHHPAHHGNRTHSHHPAHHGNRTHSHHPAHHGNRTHSHHPTHHGNMTHAARPARPGHPAHSHHPTHHGNRIHAARPARPGHPAGPGHPGRGL